MIQINDALLNEIGLANLPQEEKRSLLSHIYETLELRVGMKLADQMTNEQLDEFERYFEARDDKGAFNWLETNFPNYKEIVQEEFDKLKAEVAQSVPQILSASQANPASPAAVNPATNANPAQPYTPTNPAQPQPPYTPQPGIDNSNQNDIPPANPPMQPPVA
jgi:hypothetical protein